MHMHRTSINRQPKKDRMIQPIDQSCRCIKETWRRSLFFLAARRREDNLFSTKRIFFVFK